MVMISDPAQTNKPFSPVSGGLVFLCEIFLNFFSLWAIRKAQNVVRYSDSRILWRFCKKRRVGREAEGAPLLRE